MKAIENINHILSSIQSAIHHTSFWPYILLILLLIIVLKNLPRHSDVRGKIIVAITILILSLLGNIAYNYFDSQKSEFSESSMSEDAM